METLSESRSSASFLQTPPPPSGPSGCSRTKLASPVEWQQAAGFFSPSVSTSLYFLILTSSQRRGQSRRLPSVSLGGGDSRCCPSPGVLFIYSLSGKSVAPRWPRQFPQPAGDRRRAAGCCFHKLPCEVRSHDLALTSWGVANANMRALVSPSGSSERGCNNLPRQVRSHGRFSRRFLKKNVVNGTWRLTSFFLQRRQLLDWRSTTKAPRRTRATISFIHVSLSRFI